MGCSPEKRREKNDKTGAKKRKHRDIQNLAEREENMTIRGGVYWEVLYQGKRVGMFGALRPI